MKKIKTNLSNSDITAHVKVEYTNLKFTAVERIANRNKIPPTMEVIIAEGSGIVSIIY